jgi:hypothetical protein
MSTEEKNPFEKMLMTVKIIIKDQNEAIQVLNELIKKYRVDTFSAGYLDDGKVGEAESTEIV